MISRKFVLPLLLVLAGAVGRAEDVLMLAGPGTRVVSLNGAILLPGFHDAHCHILGFGLSLAMVPLSGVRTIPDLVHLLQMRAVQI